MLSYDGVARFGLLGDDDAAEDVALLAEGVEKSIAELGAAGPRAPSGC